MIVENVRFVFGSKRIKVVANESGIKEILVNKSNGVPVNQNGEMYINYADPKKYVQMSVTELMSDDIDVNKIQNRMIVIGLDAAGLSVLKYTPHGLTTDQIITAQALDTLLTEQYLARPAEADTYEIVFMAVLGLLMILLVP